ncbi:hypothetical protein BGZ83_003364 [Gryganskiella cystojenkinii]|nr:hypothetical protein BGZ83_003364 [Gryganskiella cystojenkinii]
MRITKLAARINSASASSSPRPALGATAGQSNTQGLAHGSRSLHFSPRRELSLPSSSTTTRPYSGPALLRDIRHHRSLLIPLCKDHDQRIFRLACSRGLWTDAYNTKQDPIFKYSNDDFNNDPGSPQEYKLRVGTAIRTLREELPQFFQHGLCNTSIYAPNIRLIEASHTNVSLQGKPVYFLLAGAVRWSFKMWFRDIEFDIQSIRVQDRGGRGLGGMDSGGDSSDMSGTANTSSSATLLVSDRADNLIEPRNASASPTSPLNISMLPPPSPPPPGNVILLDDGGSISGERGDVENSQASIPPTTVTVRWTMKGTTRPSVVLTSSGPTSPPPSSYAGVFVYQFNDYGMIDEHRIENIMPSPSPEAIQRAFAWWGWLLSRTRPTAAAATEDEGIRKRLGLGYVSNK